MHHEATRRNSDESVNGGLVHETQSGIKDGEKVSHCNFVLEHEMAVGNARLFDMDASYKVLLLARRVPGMGGRHVLNKINMMNPIGTEEIPLPMSMKAVKDLHISPCGRLALIASLGKELSLISMGGNNIVMTYKLPNPAWSCSWDANSPNYIMVCFWYSICVIQFIRLNPCMDQTRDQFIQYILILMSLLKI